ncbi:hypothetical protein ACHAW5_005160 [Stephanodiscus triporus]|uniref:Rab3 GTPase-activating protein catalytic subunit n=1 Tax=Stephanodiscus triporus TaxID=2934178 RepID=A0ABD3MYU9_9STRA
MRKTPRQGPSKGPLGKVTEGVFNNFRKGSSGVNDGSEVPHPSCLESEALCTGENVGDNSESPLREDLREGHRDGLSEFCLCDVEIRRHLWDYFRGATSAAPIPPPPTPP